MNGVGVGVGGRGEVCVEGWWRVSCFKCLGPWEEPELVLGEGRAGTRVIETPIEPKTRAPQILLIRFTNAIIYLSLSLSFCGTGGQT